MNFLITYVTDQELELICKPRDLTEMKLAHVIESKVAAAYHRGGMRDTIPKAGSVVPLKAV